jgi:hypothetical protein
MNNVIEISVLEIEGTMKYVISEVCNLKMTAFWDIAPCGPLDVD